jgi:tyrosyl-tRNA synthetase
LAAGIPAFALFVRAGLAASNGEARRLIQGGGGKVNDAALKDPAETIGNGALKDGVIKLTAGKKRHVLVKPE